MTIGEVTENYKRLKKLSEKNPKLAEEISQKMRRVLQKRNSIMKC